MGKLVEVARFYDPEEAYCAAGYLKSYGIDALVDNEHHLTTAPWLRIALDGYGLRVRDDAFDEAKNALAKIEPVAKRKKSKTKNWIWFPIAFLSGTPFLPVKRTGVIAVFQFIALLGFYVIFFVYLGWLLRRLLAFFL